MTAPPVPMSPFPPSSRETWHLLSGNVTDPHAVLGPHPYGGGTVVRVLRPGAEEVDVRTPDGVHFPLARVHPDGLFSGLVPASFDEYRLVERVDGQTSVRDDPYRWPPVLGDLDLHLIGEGRHRLLWEALGAVRRKTVAGRDAEGVSFAVWAPHALGVQVRGDFNGWDGRGHPLRLLDGGVWELFVPGVRDGSRYRFSVRGADGVWREKADPMAAATECPPANASVVHTSRHRWRDAGWMARRARTDWQRQPMSVYEVHLPSWRKKPDGGWLDYHGLAHRLAEYTARLGFTHVQLLPVAEHPFTASWGYQVTSYYAPTARHGDPDGFRYLVDHLHRHGIGVLVDFVPAHFPRDAWALARFDGTAQYEHPDPRRGEHPDWGTLIFDFARPQVRNFLVASALHWLSEFHVDGLRVDAVASMLYLDYSRAPGDWLPNEQGGHENHAAVDLLREANSLVHRHHPGAVVIAEESTAWPGVTRADGLDFDLKWNMGWMHDTLAYLGRDPAERRADARLRATLEYAWSERYMLPLSHDEVVHGKGSLWARMPGAPPARAGQLRTLLAYMWAYPGKHLLFMGGEFGQPGEWDAQAELNWRLAEADGPHRGIAELVSRLNLLYRALPALHQRDSGREGFSLLRDAGQDDAIVVFARHGDGGAVAVCAANFSDQARPRLRVAAPRHGTWSVALDTCDPAFGGLGGLRAAVAAVPAAGDGAPAFLEIDLPAHCAVWLVPDTATDIRT